MQNGETFFMQKYFWPIIIQHGVLMGKKNADKYHKRVIHCYPVRGGLNKGKFWPIINYYPVPGKKGAISEPYLSRAG